MEKGSLQSGNTFFPVPGTRYTGMVLRQFSIGPFNPACKKERMKNRANQLRIFVHAAYFKSKIKHKPFFLIWRSLLLFIGVRRTSTVKDAV